MPRSARSSGNRSGRGVDNEAFDPQIGGTRNNIAHDGYDAGDGYMMPTHPPFPPSQPSTYGDASARSRGNRRSRHFDDSESDTTDDDLSEAEDGRHGNTRAYKRKTKRYIPDTRRRSMDDTRESRFRDPWYNHDSDTDSDRSPSPRDRGRHSTSQALATRRRSLSQKVRRKMSGVFATKENNERTGNSEVKKWGATFAGAVAGGFAAQEAGRRTGKHTNWVPTALGAFLGGFGAREAEKFFYNRKANHEEEENAAWENGSYNGGRRRS